MKNIHNNSSKRFILTGVLALLAIFFIGVNQGYSQMTVVGGTTVKINPSSTLNSSESMVLNTGGTLDVQGTLVLKKNLVNNNAATNSLGTGTVVFSGSTAQTISGPNVINNLTLNNATGLTLLNDTRVNGALTLTSGLVTLADKNLVLGPLASVAGTPSASNMVVATGTGEVRKEYAAAGSFTYPVGDATGTAEYSPVTLAFNSGTFGANAYAGVNLKNEAAAGVAVTSYLTRYWNVTQSGITGFSCNTTFQYVEADVVPTESDIFSFRVLPGPFTAYNATNTASNLLTVNGLSSFGTFTGNLGDATVPPPIRSLQNKTISSGPDCADATQTMLIAGNGTTYIVTNTGNVKHIAGTNIIYYPGTKVDLGGYMRGYISNIFCNPYVHPAIQAPVISGVENPAVNPGNSVFKIYPNPTPGNFTLELNGDVTSAQVHVEIFGILGDRILSKDMQVERKQEFSLADKPTGVYVIHVSSGENSETEKIIKR